MDFIQKVVSFNACNTREYYGFQTGGCFITDLSWTLDRTEEFIQKQLTKWRGTNECGHDINLIELHTRVKNKIAKKQITSEKYQYDFKTQKLILKECSTDYQMLNTEGYPPAK